jgi:formiminoglutamase
VALGGGHEIAWGSFQGIMAHLSRSGEPRSGESPLGASLPGESRPHESPPKVGIINFDAHFDLRDPVGGGNSGTPFRQIAEWCDAASQPFHYLVVGLSPPSNTSNLFDYARSRGASWIEDALVHMGNLEWLQGRVRKFIQSVDFLYVTVCLDVFSPAIAPGVSAPAGLGISAEVVIHLLRSIRAASEDLGTPVILTDIAEMNPRHDLDGRTARLAARLVWEVCQHRRNSGEAARSPDAL